MRKIGQLACMGNSLVYYVINFISNLIISLLIKLVTFVIKNVLKRSACCLNGFINLINFIKAFSFETNMFFKVKSFRFSLSDML